MGILSKIAAALAPKPPALPPAALPPTGADPGLVALESAYNAAEYAEAMRRTMAQSAYGVVQPRVEVRTRWEPADRERIMAECEGGSFYTLGLFLDAMRSDGLISGIMRTRTAGLLGLPVQFDGDPFLAEMLRGIDPVYEPETQEIVLPGKPGDFWHLFPIEELGDVVWDGIMAGFGIGEFVPQGEGSLPRLKHLDVHWAKYDYSADRWSYQTTAGTWHISPGDGRWFMFTPYGKRRPWVKGAWFPCALPFISNLTTALDRLRWQGQLADALKVIETTEKTTEPHRDEYRRFLRYGWGRAPGVVLRQGEKASLVESTGKGFEVYDKGEASADKRIKIALSGQDVTTDGTGSGWSKGNIWDDIRRDLVKDNAEQLSNCIHDQGTNWYAPKVWGRPNNIWTRWDIRSPDQKTADARAIGDFSESMKKADELLASRGQLVDIEKVASDFGYSIPTKQADAAPGGAPKLPPPTQDEDAAQGEEVLQ